MRRYQRYDPPYLITATKRHHVTVSVGDSFQFLSLTRANSPILFRQFEAGIPRPEDPQSFTGRSTDQFHQPWFIRAARSSTHPYPPGSESQSILAQAGMARNIQAG
jgi:hypothetical protein